MEQAAATPIYDELFEKLISNNVDAPEQSAEDAEAEANGRRHREAS